MIDTFGMTQQEINRVEGDMANQEASRREMMRVSLDTIRVYNPLDIPFKFYWDSFPWVIAKQSSKDVPRYIAMHYFKKISDYIIGEQMLKEGTELLKLREKQFGKSFTDKYEENIEVWNRTPKLNDPQLMAEVYKRVIIGLVNEYGADLLPEATTQPGVNLDQRSDHDQIFSQFKLPRVSDEVPIPVAKVLTKVKANEVSQ